MVSEVVMTSANPGTRTRAVKPASGVKARHGKRGGAPFGALDLGRRLAQRQGMEEDGLGQAGGDGEAGHTAKQHACRVAAVSNPAEFAVIDGAAGFPIGYGLMMRAARCVGHAMNVFHGDVRLRQSGLKHEPEHEEEDEDAAHERDHINADFP